MRVFVTGASGHIGSALLPELLEAGHEAVGLVRSDASEAVVVGAGARAHRGTIADPEGFAGAVAAADGVIHLAFDHEAMRAGDAAGAIATDARVMEMYARVLAGTGKPLVAASGTLILAGLGRTGTEDDAPALEGMPDRESPVMALADRGVRVSAVRLPPTVHSSLDRHGFIPALIGIAREAGASGYVGDGANRWPAGHTRDVARLFRLALEKAPAGARLHAAGDLGIPFREIAEAIGKNLGVPAVSVAPEEADARFGFLGPIVRMDNPVSTARTRELLGWEPSRPGLIDDLNQGHYFAA
ncbi:MAG: SDR family oxidoreductase [Nocardiopsaceae bacterium]|nr:SDR family oxidoreductase [Nocardiopsaceae bacterium]